MGRADVLSADGAESDLELNYCRAGGWVLLSAGVAPGRSELRRSRRPGDDDCEEGACDVERGAACGTDSDCTGTAASGDPRGCFTGGTDSGQP
jgi:hypothetical protein